MTKPKWKNIVKDAVKVSAFEHLTIEAKLSKMKDLKYKKLEIQEYLKSPEISKQQKILLFKIRTRMVPNVGYNFGQKVPCKICGLAQDEQQHFTKCIFLKLKCPELLVSDLEYSDFFGDNISKMNELSKIYVKLIRLREIFIQQ